MVGWAKRVTNSFSGGLYALAAMCVAGAIVTLIAVRVRQPAPIDTQETSAKAAEPLGSR